VHHPGRILQMRHCLEIGASSTLGVISTSSAKLITYFWICYGDFILLLLFLVTSSLFQKYRG
jgi:hypothetical protein